MNRPRQTKGPYPPCFYSKHGAFYLVKQNKWTRLGTDLAGALAEYGRLMDTQAKGGMPKLIDDAMPGITRGKADATKDQYKRAGETLKRKLAKFEPEQVTTKTVYAVQESLAATPNMANRVLTVLRLAFIHAVKTHPGVTVNPCTGVKRLPEKKRDRLLSDAEWRAIHSAAGPRLRLIMELQFLTGQRIGDVLRIRRDQLIDEGITFRQKKTGNKLTVKWSPEIRAAVEAAKTLSADRPAVTLLRGKYGGPPDYRSVLLQWDEACEKAGVTDARPNDGRAGSATATKRQGKNPTALLGHTNPAMTERYLRDRETPVVDGPVLDKKKAP